ncbi:MAG: cysteine-rich CWC family protein [Candidatus Puniceispirillaceae bacterium]
MVKINVPKDTPRNVPTICSECGTDFRCRTGEAGDCWCMTSPNLKLNYQLDGTCLCPNCMADGKLNGVLNAREDKKQKRRQQRLRDAE